MNVIGFLAETEHDKIHVSGDNIYVDMSKFDDIVRENIRMKAKINELESQLVVARVM